MLAMMFVFQVLPQSQQHVWRAENAPTCALLLLSTGRRPHSQRIGGEEAEEAFAYIYIFFPPVGHIRHGLEKPYNWRQALQHQPCFSLVACDVMKVSTPISLKSFPSNL